MTLFSRFTFKCASDFVFMVFYSIKFLWFLEKQFARTSKWQCVLRGYDWSQLAFDLDLTNKATYMYEVLTTEKRQRIDYKLWGLTLPLVFFASSFRKIHNIAKLKGNISYIYLSTVNCFMLHFACSMSSRVHIWKQALHNMCWRLLWRGMCIWLLL